MRSQNLIRAKINARKVRGFGAQNIVCFLSKFVYDRLLYCVLTFLLSENPVLENTLRKKFSWKKFWLNIISRFLAQAAKLNSTKGNFFFDTE